MFALVLSSCLLLSACGGSASDASGGTTAAAAPVFATSTANGVQNGALLVSLSTSTSGAAIYFTLDGSVPTTSSQRYQSPFLVASDLTVKAIATASGFTTSTVASREFSPTVSSGALVWSDEFSNATASPVQPNPVLWTYDTGNDGFGNKELETYCAWGSNTAPCATAQPNAYVGSDGLLHIVARKPSDGVFTSARLKSEGLIGFRYGRIEARIKLPESQGMWPAFWLLGSNIEIVNWPACGELDVMEHINGANPENVGHDWTEGSVHGPSLDGGIRYEPAGFSAAAWHTYGMIWSKGIVRYYVDDPKNIYATYEQTKMKGTWPFEDGPEFLLLNLAVGGTWPGAPDTTTVFPSELLVDYVRVYAE